jgi:putative ABC transport system substrate-binding protein
MQAVISRHTTAKLFLALFLAMSLARAQPARVGMDRPTVAVIKSRNFVQYNAVVSGFEVALRKVYPSANFLVLDLEDDEVSAKLASSVEGAAPALVFTLGVPAAQLAQEHLADLPMVFALVLDPVSGGIQSPGVTMAVSPGAKLDVCARVFPGATHGVIYSGKSLAAYGHMAEACRQRGIKLVARRVDSAGAFPSAFKELCNETEFFIMLADSSLYFPQSVEFLLREAVARNVAVCGLAAPYTRAGALISVEGDYRDMGAQAGEIGGRILMGEADDMERIVAPRKQSVSFNLVVARRLELHIPAEMREQASKLFGK